MTAVLGYHEARTRAIARELGANPRALVIGHSLSLPFNPDDGLPALFPEQVLLPPYSEFAVSAAAVGAAIGGLRPLVALSTASFMFYAWPAIVNEAPLVRYVSGGLTQAPVAFHVHGGSRRAGGPQHEHTPQSMLQNAPGIRVLAPGTPADIDAALHAALTGADPTVIVDHILLADARGPVPDTPAEQPQPAFLSAGRDALLVASSLMTQRSLEAARALSEDGFGIGVLNLPVVAPAPVERVIEAARNVDAVMFVEESRGAGSPGSFLMASLAQRRPGLRMSLLCSAPAPAPFAPHLLDRIVPTTPRIADAVRELIRGAQ